MDQEVSTAPPFSRGANQCTAADRPLESPQWVCCGLARADRRCPHREPAGFLKRWKPAPELCPFEDLLSVV